MNSDLQYRDGQILSLPQARRALGQLTHTPLGGATTYVEVRADGGIWRPVVLDFFGGVVGYRLHKD